MLETTQIIICGGETCLTKNKAAVKSQFKESLKKYNAYFEATLHITGCLNLCEQGLIVALFPDEIYYQHVTVDDVDDIVKAHFVDHKIVERLIIKDPIQKKRIKSFGHLDIFRNQKRIALRNCGIINPLDINEYIAKEGYLALAMALETHTPEDIIDMVSASGLRGRGGGGFPTGKKWAFARQAEGEQKYVICNADEGDPGAFMDRAILEGDPHNILEAMAICGYAIGSSQGYIYVRAEYPVAVERLEHAIKEAHDNGFLGEKILGSTFNFDIELRLGAGAFVCGEETALIASIEGLRGMPRLKPPFPAIKGLWGMPTNVNNVETFANVPVIIVKGPEWFRKIGTEHSPGTKVFALGGKIKNTGLVEIPMGTTLKDVVYKIGGGIPNRKQFKAIQTGGPSGGCITSSQLDTPIDFEQLTKLGSMMGSGGMIIMDEDNCMVDVARFYLEFTVEESCGKCSPCREGTKRMLEILNKITEGLGTLEDLETLNTLGHMIKETSLCGLGQTAPNPVLSTLKHFKDEYLDHVLNHTCKAGVCRSITRFEITEDCIGCTQCAINCPVGAITGWPKQIHQLDTELCICCGACKQLCPVKAIITTPRIMEAN